jgi:hypothetical protein
MKSMIILMAAVVLMLNGCVSGYVIKNSKEQISIKRGNESEVSTWEAIKEQPILQLGAAIADGLIIWGGAEGVRWIADQSGDGDGDRSSATQNSGRDSIIINVNGDGNSTDVSGDVYTTTTTIGE